MNIETIKDKKVFIFDLDGTLAESLSPMSPEMAEVFCKLIDKKIVLIMTGGRFERIKRDVLDLLPCNDSLENLFLMPTSGSRFYSWEKGDWNEVYNFDFTEDEILEIISVLDKTQKEFADILPKELFGNTYLNKKSQFTFAPFGENAPHDLKAAWDPDTSKRQPVAKFIAEHLPNFAVYIGGTTSIDITRKGIDKAYGVERFFKETQLSIDDAVFVGDKLVPGGNDFAVTKTSIDTFNVDTPKDTEVLISQVISR